MSRRRPRTKRGKPGRSGKAAPVDRRVGLAQLAAALVVGAAGGTGAVVWLDQHRESEIAASASVVVEPGDRLTTALDAVREDGVYVAPDGRDLVDATGERAIEAAVAAQEVPVYVIVWAADQQVGLDSILTEDVLERELPDEDGFVFVWEGPQQGTVIDLGPRGGSPSVSTALDFVGDPATTLVGAVEAVSPDDFYSYRDGDDDYWGGLGGGSLLGVMLASGIVGVVLLVAKLTAVSRGRRRLLPGGWRLHREDGS